MEDKKTEAVEIDIQEYAERGEKVPHARTYIVRIDGNPYRVETPTPTGRMLLALVGKRPCAFNLVAEFTHHETTVIGPDEMVDLREHGLKGFTTAHREKVIVFFGEAKTPYEIQGGDRTVAEIMALPGDGKTPDGYDLYMEEPGKPLVLLQATLPVKIGGCEVFFVQVKSGTAA